MDKLLHDFDLSLKQIEQFQKYYQYLVEENKKINLTSIIEETEAYIKHFYDSMMVSKFIDLNNSSICDIGSGAGFPSIPLKILIPSLKVTIIEPTLKRIKFLNQLCLLLGLENVELINGRAEEEIASRRENYDYVTARAVANLPVLLELCVPYVKKNGKFVALKGYNYQEELEASKNAIKTLDLVYDIKTYQLPLDMGSRALILFTKQKETSKIYPRKYAIIKKKPL